MYFQNTLAALLLAPIVASTPTFWTFENFTRTSDENLTVSSITFTISGENLTQPCSYHVSGSPSTEAPYQDVLCGDFIIASGWSSQFGPENSFTTLSVKKDNLIAWPSYKDTELKNGSVVMPDRSFQVKELSTVF